MKTRTLTDNQFSLMISIREANKDMETRPVLICYRAEYAAEASLKRRGLICEIEKKRHYKGPGYSGITHRWTALTKAGEELLDRESEHRLFVVCFVDTAADGSELPGFTKYYAVKRRGRRNGKWYEAAATHCIPKFADAKQMAEMVCAMLNRQVIKDLTA